MAGAPALIVDALADLQRVADDAVERYGTPGVVSGLDDGHDASVVVVGDRALGGAPMTRASVFRIASLTKPIVAAATLALADRGTIALCARPRRRRRPSTPGRRPCRSRRSPASWASRLTDRYAVELSSRAAKALRKLDRPVQARVLAALALLRQQPRPRSVAALAGHPGLLRVRVGDHRIVYRVQDDRLILLVLVIGHRRDVHEALP